MEVYFSGNIKRMENGGGKRKRVGLSLKSFKKPALNYVEKQPVGKRLEERPSDNDKLNSRLEKFDWRSAKQIETSISETRSVCIYYLYVKS